MAQLVTRLDDRTAADIDRLVAEGVVDSRSDAVRQGLALLLDRHRRRRIAASIVAGYEAHPQTEEEVSRTEQAAVEMITDEPW
jgi:Arc/MetJ-type ribon-helix-helix transcriptional regulator